jgi:hypothetical protein
MQLWTQNIFHGAELLCAYCKDEDCLYAAYLSDVLDLAKGK